ncbi:MAG: substrate-binding domain-containing protein [Termitinemataceae bacterium]
MRRNVFSLILIISISAVLALATLLNIALIGKSRAELSKTILKNPAAVKTVKKHIIAILPSVSDPFFANLYYGLNQASIKNSAALELFSFSPEVEVSQIFVSAEAYRYFDIAIRSRPDGIVMFFPPGSDIRSFSEKAREKKVPFIPVAVDQPAQELPALVTSDSFLQGTEAVIIALGLLGRDAKIGVILPAGFPNSFVIAEEPFLNGAVFELNRRQMGKIVAAEREEESILGGEEVCTTMLQRYPEINCFICTNARSTVSAAQVVIDRGMVGKIVIIGADENEEIARLLEKGVIQATIVRDAIRMGEAAVTNLLKSETGSGSGTITKVSTYTKFSRTDR